MSAEGLRDYQIDAVSAVMRALKRGVVHPLVESPTGSGKSHMIAGLADRLPGRVLILTHRIRLLRQNAAKVLGGGIVNAQFGDDTFESHRVLTATYQTAAHRQIGDPDYIVLDECHLLTSDDDSLLATYLAHYGDVPVVGFTATPFRQNTSIYVEDGGMWSRVYQITPIELIKRGYLIPPKTVRTGADIDIDSADLMDVTRELVEPVIASIKEHRRKRVLVFCQDSQHADYACQLLPNARVVHSGLTQKQIDTNHGWFEARARDTRFLVSVNMLLIGYDNPAVDAIVLWRCIRTIGVYVQVVGRGLRPYKDLRNCLLLDFGGAVIRFGPIDSPITPGRQGGGGEVVLKKCPECDAWHNPSVRQCTVCDHVFTFKCQIDSLSSGDIAIGGGLAVDVVQRVNINTRVKPAEVQIVLADSNTGIQEFYSRRADAEKRQNLLGKRVVVSGHRIEAVL